LYNSIIYNSRVKQAYTEHTDLYEFESAYFSPAPQQLPKTVAGCPLCCCFKRLFLIDLIKIVPVIEGEKLMHFSV
jgi:hypothetical protein